MIERFEGSDGFRNLVTALKNCSIIEHDEAVAKNFADIGQLLAFKSGDIILSQGASDNDIYFILFGQADVLVNNRHIAIREAGDTVGEMAILNPVEPRAATVKARSDMVAFKVSESDFQRIVEDHPHLWKAVARVVAERLRHRANFLNLPNTLPLLFLGCSAESLSVAQEIQLGLKHDNIEVMIWTDGVFGPSNVTLDALLNVVHQSDFAAFVFSPDDKTVSRDQEYNAPRDNVIFELGLFMGQLERNRTFIIKEQKTDVKIPTDLLGISPITYVHSGSSNLSTSVAPVCTELRKVVKNLGTR